MHSHLIEGSVIRRQILKEREEGNPNVDNGPLSRRGAGNNRKNMQKGHVPYIKKDLGTEGPWKKLPIAWRIKGRFGNRALLGSGIAKFLRRLEFQEADKDDFGVTWIELFVLYKAMGNDDPIPQNGRGAKVLPSLEKQLKVFKAKVRKIGREGIKGVCGNYLKAGAKKGYALKRLGVRNHMSALRGRIRMSEKVQMHVDKEILRANGNLLKDLESQVKGEKQVKFGALTLKRKARWTKGVKKLPKELLEEFLEEPVKPEAEQHEEAPRVRKPGNKRLSASVEAPVHDFVQPPVAKGNKRKANTEAPPKEVFALRASMLSIRLRERFGYLCTDTG